MTKENNKVRCTCFSVPMGTEQMVLMRDPACPVHRTAATTPMPSPAVVTPNRDAEAVSK